MANPVRIGLYLTDKNIVLAEMDSKLKRVISSAIASGVGSPDVPLHSDINEEIHVVGALQKILRENKIDSPQVCVSIPNEEVFLRSFVVPWMPANELQNVVYYEAKKYVPFDLKLLDYVYQSFSFVENKQKKLRVIFYAVRKQTLEKYDRIFKQTNCKPVVYEPSLVSLAKYLVNQKQLKVDQKTVVVYTRENYGQIIFYERGVSYFVREFSLSMKEVAGDSKAIPDIMRAQLLREVRKSFGYYSRQFSPEKIKEMLILSSESDQELAKNLVEEFSVKVRFMESSVKFALQKVDGVEALCTAGVSLHKMPSGLAPFNFLLPKTTASMQPSVPSFLTPFYQLLAWDKSEFIYAIQAFGICALILGGGFFYGKFTLESIKKKNFELVNKQGDLANKSIEEIDNEIKQNKAKADNYNRILHDTSDMTSLLVHLTRALSEGMWFEKIDVQGSGANMIITLQGYVAASAVEGGQFKVVQGFLIRLKNDPILSAIKFKLNGIQKKDAAGREAFYFLVTGNT